MSCDMIRFCSCFTGKGNNKVIVASVKRVLHINSTVLSMTEASGVNNGHIPCNIAQKVEVQLDDQEAKSLTSTNTHSPSPDPQTTQQNESQQLSKRAKKRLARLKFLEEKKQRYKENKKKNAKGKDDHDKITEKQLQETSYYFENGLRKVYPYRFTFETFAKGRWVGEKLLDIFVKEFRYDTAKAYEGAIQTGLVTVNGKIVDLNYVLKGNDYIQNTVHRHELPVTGEDIEVLEDDDKVLVINKPSSIPIHPCGRYRHNSLMFILAKEFNYHRLRSFYRLDRLTSGVMIFPKTEQQTSKMMNSVLKREVLKTYVCKVEGVFPEESVVCEEPLGQLDQQLGLSKVDKSGKYSKTTFHRLSYDPKSNTSIVKCHPHTGRTHQIRVHLQWLGFPITNDPLYNSPVWGPQCGKGGEFSKTLDQLVEDLKKHHSIENLDIPPEGLDLSKMAADDNTTKIPDLTYVTGAKTDDDNDTTKIPDMTNVAGAKTDDDNVDTMETPDESDPDLLPPAKRPRLECDKKPDTSDKKPGCDPSKLKIDEKCTMCKRKFREPTPEKLIMYLHALSYKGPDWEYSTPMPTWTQL